MKTLEKYFRRDIWNAGYRISAKSLEKYFRRDIWNAVHRSSVKPLEKIFWKGILERRSQIFCEAS